MEKERLLYFIKELIELQEKHGIIVSVGYEEIIDYNWDEEPYTSGCNAFLVYRDIETGEEILEEDIPYEDDEDCDDFED